MEEVTMQTLLSCDQWHSKNSDAFNRVEEFIWPFHHEAAPADNQVIMLRHVFTSAPAPWAFIGHVGLLCAPGYWEGLLKDQREREFFHLSSLLFNCIAQIWVLHVFHHLHCWINPVCIFICLFRVDSYWWLCGLILELPTHNSCLVRNNGDQWAQGMLVSSFHPSSIYQSWTFISSNEG